MTSAILAAIISTGGLLATHARGEVGWEFGFSILLGASLVMILLHVAIRR